MNIVNLKDYKFEENRKQFAMKMFAMNNLLSKVLTLFTLID